MDPKCWKLKEDTLINIDEINQININGNFFVEDNACIKGELLVKEDVFIKGNLLVKYDTCVNGVLKTSCLASNTKGRCKKMTYTEGQTGIKPPCNASCVTIKAWGTGGTGNCSNKLIIDKTSFEGDTESQYQDMGDYMGNVCTTTSLSSFSNVSVLFGTPLSGYSTLTFTITVTVPTNETPGNLLLKLENLDLTDTYEIIKPLVAGSETYTFEFTGIKCSTELIKIVLFFNIDQSAKGTYYWKDVELISKLGCSGDGSGCVSGSAGGGGGYSETTILNPKGLINIDFTPTLTNVTYNSPLNTVTLKAYNGNGKFGGAGTIFNGGSAMNNGGGGAAGPHGPGGNGKDNTGGGGNNGGNGHLLSGGGGGVRCMAGLSGAGGKNNNDIGGDGGETGHGQDGIGCAGGGGGGDGFNGGNGKKGGGGGGNKGDGGYPGGGAGSGGSPGTGRVELIYTIGRPQRIEIKDDISYNSKECRSWDSNLPKSIQSALDILSTRLYKLENSGPIT
jgi:hypothetical protein